MEFTDSSGYAPDARSPGSRCRPNLPIVRDRWADSLRHPGSTRPDGRTRHLSPPVLLDRFYSQHPFVSSSTRQFCFFDKLNYYLNVLLMWLSLLQSMQHLHIHPHHLHQQQQQQQQQPGESRRDSSQAGRIKKSSDRERRRRSRSTDAAHHRKPIGGEEVIGGKKKKPTSPVAPQHHSDGESTVSGFIFTGMDREMAEEFVSMTHQMQPHSLTSSIRRRRPSI